MDISFIILSYNSENCIEECILSYAEAVSKDSLVAEFLIVDNGSFDNTAKLLEEKIFSGLTSYCSGKLYQMKKNHGTTVTRNLALKDAKGRVIVICDSDTVFLSGSLREGLNYLTSNESVGLIAPRLFLEDGSIQNSVKLFPTFIDKFVKLGKIFFGTKYSKSDFYKDFPWDNQRAVDTAISAFWMFPRQLLDTVGYLDEKIFYAPEDVDLCLRIWKSGKKIFYYPKINIVHKIQQISHSRPFGKIAISQFRGLIYYFRKHGYLFSRKKLYENIGIENNVR
ncbi:glycosyltransferase family 2 protein [Elusimicrobiota bacterium]